MIKFRYKRKESTNVVGNNSSSNSNNNSSLVSSPTSKSVPNSPSSCTQLQKPQQNTCNDSADNTNKENNVNINKNSGPSTAAAAGVTSATSSNCSNSTSHNNTNNSSNSNNVSIKKDLIANSMSINVIKSAPQVLPHIQHCQMIVSNNGTLPRSSPKKPLFTQEGNQHKSSTLTRQSNTVRKTSALAKVSSSVELAGMGYAASNSNGINNMSADMLAERDRCINAVIVSFKNKN